MSDDDGAARFPAGFRLIRPSLERLLEAAAEDGDTRAEMLALIARERPDAPLAELRALEALVDELIAQNAAENAAERPREARGLTEKLIRTTAHNLRQKLDRSPTRLEVAGALHTSESTLQRAMAELGMPPWPPAPPDD